MTGRALFNEVFLDEARVRNDSILGGENNGWAVTNTTLMNERAGLGGGAAGMRQAMPGQKAGNLGKRVGDLAGKGLGGQVALAGRGYQAMAELAKSEGRTDDPHIRQRLVELYTLNEIGRMSVLRAKAARKSGVKTGPGGEPNMAKLLMSRITRLTRDLGLDIEGPKGMLWGKDAPFDGAMQELTTFAPAVSIYGGSDEVQKNIIGERVLGLPKEPGNEKDLPFKDLKVGTQR
jgi:alkylation response protein AidB-like acyl-CoA dehydrogenase